MWHDGDFGNNLMAWSIFVDEVALQPINYLIATNYEMILDRLLEGIWELCFFFCWIWWEFFLYYPVPSHNRRNQLARIQVLVSLYSPRILIGRERDRCCAEHHSPTEVLSRVGTSGAVLLGAFRACPADWSRSFHRASAVSAGQLLAAPRPLCLNLQVLRSTRRGTFSPQCCWWG